MLLAAAAMRNLDKQSITIDRDLLQLKTVQLQRIRRCIDYLHDSVGCGSTLLGLHVIKPNNKGRSGTKKRNFEIFISMAIPRMFSNKASIRQLL